MDTRMRLRYATLNFASSVLAVASLLSLAGCGGGSSTNAAAPVPPPPPPAPSPSSFTEHEVRPQDIDPGVTTALESHVAITPSSSVAEANRLFVFLPGTQGYPELYKLIVEAAARRGFHSIGLNYDNNDAVGIACLTSTDADCFWDVRREVVTGTDYSSDVHVGAADAIVPRLTKALTYLNQTYPTEGWGQYLSSGAVNWSKVVVGGHSQGGGHAGVMTKLYSMSRACYFASPPDWDLNTSGPAAWESRASQAPATPQFGFAGLDDPSVPYDQLSVIWQTLGLGAASTDVVVGANTTAFNGSRRLTTSLAPDTSTDDPGTPLHGVTVRDAFTPKTPSGQPVFDAAWGYLCFQ
jgi:hypothetical protein